MIQKGDRVQVKAPYEYEAVLNNPTGKVMALQGLPSGKKLAYVQWPGEKDLLPVLTMFLRKVNDDC